MNTVKVVNKRSYGNLFHYAHFMAECLMEEINLDLYKYDRVVRQKSVNQTIGNFSKLYEEVMGVESVELSEEEFNKLDVEVIETRGCNEFAGRWGEIVKFKDFIFSKYDIKVDNSYPEVILIKRAEPRTLIDDEELSKDPQIVANPDMVNTGSGRRSIMDIDKLEEYMSEKYSSYKTLVLEDVSFEEQVKYFYNAKLIVAVHGAALMNLVFCNQGTKIVEVEPIQVQWFKRISEYNKLVYYASDNRLEDITTLLGKIM